MNGITRAFMIKYNFKEISKSNDKGRDILHQKSKKKDYRYLAFSFLRIAAYDLQFSTSKLKLLYYIV